MADKNKAIEAEKKAEVVKTTYVLKGNVGSNPDGKPKKKKGAKVSLTDEEAKNYKSQNLI